MDTLTREKSASVVALDCHGRVLVCPWKKDRTKFTLPGGKGKPGESHLEIALREFWEETGIKLDPYRLLAVIRYDSGGRDYVGYVTTQDLTGATFEPHPGETRPVWMSRAVLIGLELCPYAEATRREWLWAQPELGDPMTVRLPW